jgi:pilus assembly protein CpaB
LKRRIIAMIGIAAVFGAVSIVAADFWLRSQTAARADTTLVAAAPAVPQVEFGRIVVAAAPLRYGMTLEPGQLAEIPWPRDTLPHGAFASVDALMADGARVVLSPIEPNEPVLLAKLSGTDGRASLANLLTPGMRAVTIRTDEIAGVGGFITPGDRVDVVLTRDAGAIHEVQGNARGAAGSTITSEIVVANARVLTVGQGADERRIDPLVASSVTIEVTGEGAQKVALARNVGTLSLSLRSAGEAGMSPDGVTTISDFGGSFGTGIAGAMGSLIKATAKEPEGPKLKTVIITRGVDGTQSYQVNSQQP